MSIPISRFEKNISLQLFPVDAIGDTLLQRIQSLLKTRPDLSKAEFFRLIGRPTPSWASEFWSGKRTTNNLRLVIRIARFFKVPVAYLLDEPGPPTDPTTVSLLGVLGALEDADREALLQVALSFQRRAEAAAGQAGQRNEPTDRGGRNTGGSNAHPRGKRR